MSTTGQARPPRPPGETPERLLARVAFETTWERQLDSSKVQWDDRFDSVFGYPRDEVADDISWWRARVHPDDLDRAEQALAEALRAGDTHWSSEYRFHRKDGSWAWVWSVGVVLRDAQDGAPRAVGALIDISRLKESESRLRLLCDQIPARAAATDRDLRVVWDAGARLAGKQSTVGKTVAELFADSPDRERVLDACARALEGEPRKLQISDGESAVQLQLGPVRDALGEVIGVMGVALDVTERAKAESALRDTQRILVAALRVGGIRAWEDDLRTGVVKIDSAAAAEPGAGLFEQRAEPDLWRDIHPDDQARVMELRQRVLDEGLSFETEFRSVRAEGEERHVLVRGELVRDAAGRPERVLGVALDVTGRVRAEEEVRKSQRLLQRVLDTIPVGVVVVDQAGDAIHRNPEAERIWGGKTIISGAERWVKSKGWWHDTGKPIGAGEWASERALSKGETSLAELIDIEAFDGRRKVMENSAAPIRDGEGTIVGAVVVNQEVTASQRAHEEVARRARQQAAVAQLSLSALKGDGLEPLLQTACATVATTLGVEYSMVAEWLPEAEEMALRATAGPWDEEAVRRIPVRTVPGLMGWFYLRSQLPVVVEDLAGETRFAPCELLLAHSVKSGIAVPIAGNQRPFGVLEANTREHRAFTDDEVSFVWSVANVLATAIGQRRAADELQEHREQLRVLSGKLLEAQEAERRALARELHDDFGQVLTAIKLNLMRKERDDAESIALVDGAIARVRDLAHDLRPPMLDELGLPASLRWYFAREANRAGLEFRFAMTPPERRPSPVVEATCFRVAQEALTNIIRHAHARRVEVELRVDDGALVLTVSDDGRGFDVASARQRAARGGGQGLSGMHERVALAGGQITLESSSKGTAIRARFPNGGAS